MHQHKWLAVVNEHAGGGKTTQKWPMIQRKLLDYGISVDAQITEKAGDALRLTSKGLQDGYTGIIAVGGDGTLNEAVNGFWHEAKLINPAAVLTFINLGTGGDFARTVNAKDFRRDRPGENPDAFNLADVSDGLDEPDVSNESDVSNVPDESKASAAADKSDVSDQVNRLLSGGPQIVDVGLARFEGTLLNSRYFINAANVGVGAETVRRVNAYEAKLGGGRLSFLRGALTSILTYKPRPMRVVVDGECKIDKELYAVMVCNGRFIGAGMMIAPRAEITDALFDIVAIERMPLPKLLTQFPKIYSGTHLSVKGISYWQGSQVEISEPELRVWAKAPAGKALPGQTAAIVELDGEILGCCPASYTLLPQAMTLWLPA